VVRIIQDNVAGHAIGDDVLQVRQIDLLLDANKSPGCLYWHYFTVIRVGEGVALGTGAVGIVPTRKVPKQPAGRLSQDTAKPVFPSADADVKIGPPPVDIAVQPIEKRVAWRAPCFLKESYGRRTQQAMP
jgi:hypothetical protein